MSAAINSLLVIGDAKVGKKFVAQRLAVNASTPTKLPHSNIESFHLTLDTKYYTAPLALHVLPGSTHASFATVQTEAEEKESDKDADTLSSAKDEFAAIETQAVLLVFDLARAETFHSLANSWASYLEETEPGVMMLVGNEVAPSKPEAELSQAEIAARRDLETFAKDWAIDHQIEYVFLPHNDAIRAQSNRLANPASSSSMGLSSSSSDDADLEAAAEPIGLSRILESLECNQWNELTMKDRRVAQQLAKAQLERELREEREREEQQLKEEEEMFAGMTLKHEQEQAEAAAESVSDEKFEEFVSAASDATTASALSSSSASSSSSSTSASTSAASTTSKTTSSSSSSSHKTPSASASAFANAFANAIRVPESKEKNLKTTSTTTLSSSSKPESASLPSLGSAVDSPMSSEEIDAFTAQLAAATGEIAVNETVGAEPEQVVPAGEAKALKVPTNPEYEAASFDKLFETINAMKTDLNKVRADGSSMTDAERRKKAEDNVRLLLKQMGMEDELDGLSDEEL